MTKKDDALKQALEALEGLFVTHPHYTDEGGGAVAVWKLGGSYAARDAIEKIKSALAQPEQEPVQPDHIGDALKLARLFHTTYERLAPNFGYETRTDTKVFNPLSANGQLMLAVCSEIYCALVAQPEQEPVAWQDTANHMEIVSAEDWVSQTPMWHWMYRPLYTSPPQRQPLTNEQIWQLVNDCSFNRDLHADKFARAIEAAHGIGETND